MKSQKKHIIVGMACLFVSFVASGYFLRGDLRAFAAARERASLPPALPASSFGVRTFPVALNKKITQKEAPLPSRFNLAVPFTSQAPEKNWNQPWQDACEEAAVLMLDAYQKGYILNVPVAKKELLKMIAWEEAKNWGVSIPAVKMKQLMEWYGSLKHESIKALKHVSIIERPTVEQIKKMIVSGHPVLALARGKSLHNPHYNNGGPEYHALIIRGYTEDSFITNDPGTQFGEAYLYRYDVLLNALHDWNNGDVAHGVPMVLVAE